MKTSKFYRIISLLAILSIATLQGVLASNAQGVLEQSPIQIDSLWHAEGLNRQSFPDGSAEIDLGKGVPPVFLMGNNTAFLNETGVHRIDLPNGRSEIQGLSYQGIPVVFDLDGKNELWHSNLNELAKTFTLNAVWQAPSQSGTFEFTRSGVEKVRYAQLLPGIQGNQQSILTFSDGRQISIFSQHELSMAHLQNIALVISDAPSKTFTPWNTTYALFVVDNLGEVRVVGQPFVSLGGLHDAASGSIFIRTGELDRYESTASILRHESGHSLDARYGWLSKSLASEKGELLFGKGVLNIDDQGAIDLHKSSFKSAYAASNAAEDFAETHEFLLRFRQVYNTSHPDQDLFKLTPGQLKAELEKRDFSKELLEKMTIIVSSVYADSAVAVGESFNSVKTAASPVSTR